MKKNLFILLIALMSMGHVFAEEGTAKIIILYRKRDILKMSLKKVSQ